MALFIFIGVFRVISKFPYSSVLEDNEYRGYQVECFSQLKRCVQYYEKFGLRNHNLCFKGS